MRPILAHIYLDFLKTPRNNTMRGIIGRNANLHSIPLHHANALLLHTATEDPPDNRLIVTFYLHASAANDLIHHAFELDQVVSAHSPPLKLRFFITAISVY
jgi:hypothetical protein